MIWFSSFLQICAHRWKDNYLNLNYDGISHMNGICYQLNASLSRTARKIPALSIRERLVHRDRYTEFSMGELGTSAMFIGVTLTFTYLCLLTFVYLCLTTFVCVPLSVYLCLSTFVCLNVFLPLSVYLINVCLSTYVCLLACVPLSVYLCLCTFFCVPLSVFLCLSTFVCLPLSVYLCLCTFVFYLFCLPLSV